MRMNVKELIQILENVENKSKNVYFSFIDENNCFHYLAINEIKREKISASFDNEEDIIIFSFEKPIYI